MTACCVMRACQPPTTCLRKSVLLRDLFLLNNFISFRLQNRSGIIYQLTSICTEIFQKVSLIAIVKKKSKMFEILLLNVRQLPTILYDFCFRFCFFTTMKTLSLISMNTISARDFFIFIFSKQYNWTEINVLISIIYYISTDKIILSFQPFKIVTCFFIHAFSLSSPTDY